MSARYDDLDDELETTADVDDARRAAADALTATVATARVIDDMRTSMARIRAAHEANHFADKFRAIIRGAT